MAQFLWRERGKSMQLKPREEEPNTEGLDSGAVDTESANVSSEYNGDLRPSNNDFLNDPKPMDDFSDLEEEPYVIGMNGSGVGLNDKIIKLFVQVVVTVTNYIISKFFVFKKFTKSS